MAREVIVQAASPQEAIQRAASLLGLSPDGAVAVEIKPGRRCLLGLLRRPGVYRITWDDAHPAPAQSPAEVPAPAPVPTPAAVPGPTPESASGPTLVEVVDGRLRIHPGAGGPARVRVGPGVLLFVDGRPVAPGQVVPLSGRERVEVKLEPPAETPAERPARGFDLRVDAGGMRATLRLFPRRVCRLKDSPPSPTLLLERVIEAHLDDHVTVESIRQALVEAGITHGVDDAALEQALASPPDEAVVVARGTPPQHGADGWVEALVPCEYEALYVVDEDGQVDFRDRPDIPFVRQGTPIAVVHPPEPGRPGMDVRGNPVPARPGAPVVLRSRAGVRRCPENDGRVTIIATRDGRPVIESYGGRLYEVAVLDTYRHHGDVDMTTGNIHYPGDVWIEGSVTEGMAVTAGGHLIILGNVLRARVAAAGDVEVRGSLIQGRAIAGWKSLIYHELAGLVPDLETSVQRVAAAMGQIRQAASFRSEDLDRIGSGRLLDVLLSMKFPDLVKLAARVLHTVDRYLPHVAHDDLLQEFRQGLRALARQRAAADFSLEKFQRACAEIRQAAALQEVTVGQVRVGYAQGADIRAGGAVTVLRRGTYFSHIRSGSQVWAYGPIIGGRVEAAENIHALEAGSEALATTELVVPARGSIRIQRAHPDVRLQIGSVKRRLEKEMTRVHARLRGDDMILHQA